MSTLSHVQVKTTRSFLHRLMGAVLLDGAVYEDIEADPRATIQATAVVLLASFAPVIGLSTFFGFQIDALLRVAALSIGTWILWAVLIFQIGVRLLPDVETKSSLGELLRTTGFAAAPGVLQVFVMFPGMMWPVFIGTWIWMIAAMVVGVGHALDYRSSARALRLRDGSDVCGNDCLHHRSALWTSRPLIEVRQDRCESDRRTIAAAPELDGGLTRIW